MGTFEYTGFYDLLADSLFNYKQALKHDKPYIQNRYARASTISIILSIESASNCLISSLEDSKALREDLDKLTAIGKLDVFAKIKQQKGIDRGRNEVAKIKELIKMRNDYVHPKTKNIDVDISGTENLKEHFTVNLSIDGEEWENLKIPKRAMFWSGASAEVVIKTATDFYNYYFKEVLGYTPDEVDMLLKSKIRFNDMLMEGVFHELKDEVFNSKFDFSFLKS